MERGSSGDLPNLPSSRMIDQFAASARETTGKFRQTSTMENVGGGNALNCISIASMARW